MALISSQPKTPASDRAIYPSLKAKRVLITGGATGIGAALVEGFAFQGADVFFLDIAIEAAEALVQRLAAAAGSVHAFACDLTDLGALAAVLARIQADFGPIEILVNNAANDDRHQLDQVSGQYWDERINVNLRHMVFAAKAVAPAMQAAGRGVIINFGSMAWRMAAPNMVLYATAKAAVEGMTRALARDLGGYGIRVTCVAPGAVRTPRQERWIDAKVEAALLASQCLKSRIEPDNVAALVLFLASDDAKVLTGHAYCVDAGYF